MERLTRGEGLGREHACTCMLTETERQEEEEEEGEEGEEEKVEKKIVLNRVLKWLYSL